MRPIHHSRLKEFIYFNCNRYLEWIGKFAITLIFYFLIIVISYFVYCLYYYC